jgi:hypothetical protein
MMPMGIRQSLAVIPQTFTAWFRPNGLNSIRALRQAGSAIGILAESFTTDADEWNCRDGKLDRRGVEVTWRGNLASPRTRVHVQIDGKTVRMYASEGEVLRQAAAEMVAKRSPPTDVAAVAISDQNGPHIAAVPS